MFPALKEAEGKLAAKQAELKGIFDEAGPELDMSKVKSVAGGDRQAVLEHIRALNAELDELGAKAGELREIQAAADRAARIPGQRESGDGSDTKGAGDKHERELKSIGELFTASDAFKRKQRGQTSGPVSSVDVELKTLMTTSAGWAPEVTRTGRIAEYAYRPVQILDLIPQTTTGQAAVQYMEETTSMNAAAEVAEGGTYAESALALTEMTSNVRKIATFLPVTDEQLEDEPQARGLINNRLPLFVRLRLDGQVVNGNGTAPNLRGFLNVVGIQTQAKATDTAPDAVYKALTKIRVTGRATPGSVIMHPTDWQGIRLLKDSTGQYIWGSPTEAGPERIWGLPVAQSDVIAQGTALAGDFATHTELAMRRGIDVQISNSHGTFFVEGKQAIRADVRCALVVYRPAALCTVTGL